VTFPLAIAQLLFSFTMIGFCCINISPTLLQYRPDECVGLGFCLLFSSGMSIVFVNLIALERFQYICKGRDMTRRGFVCVALLLLLEIVILAILPLLSGSGSESGYVITVTGLYCVVDWASSVLTTKMASILAVSNMSITFIFNFYCYCRIFLFYWRVARKVAQPRLVAVQSYTHQADESATAKRLDGSELGENAPPPSRTLKPQRRSYPERRVFVRSFMHVLMYMVFWMPYCLLICYETLGATQVSSGVHLVCSYLASISTACNPLCIIFLTSGFKEEIQSLLRCTTM
jgi:hypothetical protein